MKKTFFKMLIIIVMILGIALSVLHFISVDSFAIGIPIFGKEPGTLQSNGLCLGDPTSC